MKLFDIAFRIRREDYTLQSFSTSDSYKDNERPLECTNVSEYSYSFKQTLSAEDIFEAERILKNDAYAEALKQLAVAELNNRRSVRVSFDLDHITFEF